MKTLDATTRVSVKNILFATDFSPNSNAALPYAMSLARQYDARLYPAHVITLKIQPWVLPEYWKDVAEAAEQQANEEFIRLEEKLRGIPHEVVFRQGDIWEVLSGIIEAKKIDLLVVGTHGRTGIQKLLLGSVAEQIFRQAPCPVLTVGPNVRRSSEGVIELRQVLYATDFSPESLVAAPYAISLAQEHQAQLALLHVVERTETARFKDPELSAASLLHRLHTLIPPEAELWCHPKCFVDYGSVPERVLEFATKRNADLIALGVRRPQAHLKASTHLAQGIAYKIVSQAPCPVLTVRG